MLLQLKYITKVFPGVKALNKINFSCDCGEIVGLVGENGAGKSTLMNIIMGIYSPEEGLINFRGEEMASYNPRVAREKGISIVYQELDLIPYLSVAENIFLNREPKGKGGFIDHHKILERTKEILNELELDIEPKSWVCKLSLADQQMVAIIRALEDNAKLLIMDEPTSALSDNEVEKLFGFLKRVKQKGTGIIYISHRLKELLTIADKIVVLRDGEIVLEERISNVEEKKLILAIVGGKLEKFWKERYISVKKGCRKFKENRKVLMKVENLCSKGKFNNISFELHENEAIGITGLVGAGKTEVAKSLFGTLKIDEGRIILEGKEIKIGNPSGSLKLGIGLVPEEKRVQGLVLDLGVSNNLTLCSLKDILYSHPFSIMGLISSSKEKKFSKNMVLKLNIKTSSLDKEVRHLSGGNQQKVVVGKWLQTKPKILIFDEPTRGIDVGSKAEIYNLIKKLSREGTSVIFISSDVKEVLQCSDRILVMNKGEITHRFDKLEGITEEELELMVAASVK